VKNLLTSAPQPSKYARVAAKNSGRDWRPEYVGAQAPIADAGAFFMPASRRDSHRFNGGRREGAFGLAGSYIRYANLVSVHHPIGVGMVDSTSNVGVTHDRS
jgi:hypothetical protein